MKSKFTLVELLVVIAIISILAGMLLPVLESARESAIAVNCVSNLKQMGVFLAMYADDFDGYYPRGKEVIGGNPYTWASIILRTSGLKPPGEWAMNSTSEDAGVAETAYGHYEAFRCPGLEKGKGIRRGAPMQQVYGMSSVMTGKWADWRYLGGAVKNEPVVRLGTRPLSSAGLGFYVYKNPSRMIVLADTYAANDNNSGQGLSCGTGNPGQFYWFSCGTLLPQLRHNDNLNALMLDGSAGGLSLGALYDCASGNPNVWMGDGSTMVEIVGEASFN